jgi:hypothetical protein
VEEKWDRTLVKEGLFVGKITFYLAQTTLTSNISVMISSNLLVDPNIYQSKRIDLLLGADVYGRCLMNGLIKRNVTGQKTELS